MSPKRNHSFITLLIVLAFFGVSISCQLPFSLNETETPSPIPVTPTPQAAACTLPNLVGMDSQAAEAVLTALNLTLQRSEEFNAATPGQVVAQQPKAGTRLNSCAGEVTIVVSQGPQETPTKAAIPTKPEPSATPSQPPTATQPAATEPPVPTKTPEGPFLEDSENYDLLLSELFPARDAYGLLTERWKRVAAAPGSQVESNDGWLQVAGKFEFYGGGAFQHNVRVLIGGGTYGIGLNEFTVFVDYQDDKNNLRMSCDDLTGLRCDWYQLQAGKETLLTKSSFFLCTGVCDLQIELDQGNIRVYANDEQRMTLRNTTYPTGQIGVRIDAPAVANFELDRIVVYNIPKGATAKTMFREDFGDNLSLGSFDGEYIGVNYKQVPGVLQINCTAKQGAFYYQRLKNSWNLPDTFQISLSTRILSGAKTAAIGFIFRHQDEDNYFAYLIDNNGEFVILAKTNGEWSRVVDWQPAAGYRAGETNLLAIKAQGSDYTVLLNNRQVGQFTDDRFTGGRYGIAVELDNTGDQLRAEIYQIEARR